MPLGVFYSAKFPIFYIDRVAWEGYIKFDMRIYTEMKIILWILIFIKIYNILPSLSYVIRKTPKFIQDQFS